ncbi:MAG: LysM peptidoglycan-binding protein [Marmoricola sp.]|jgi:LysM repeat protein|nr:LysM peptidoglycan-binding protein [Marmoricola sp.]
MSLPRRRPPARRARLLAGLAGALTAFTLLPGAAEATPWPGHPDRSIVRHTVRPGDTATGLAVRYHAWTAELIRLNGLGSRSALAQGQVLRIPVVLSAVRRAGGKAPRPAPRRHSKKTPPAWLAMHATRPTGRGWLHADLTREQVRRLVTVTAKHYGVPPKLALAIAWQESGWQQRRVSITGAIGVMQVMPDTGRWMRWYVGRPLRLRDTHDNVLAGVMTLRVLRAWTRRDDNAIAAYYQGLGAVREHGYFEDTKQYVAAVRAHERRIVRTGSPG